MRSKKVLCLLVAVCFGLVMAGVAVATDKGPETITMDSKVYPKHKKSLVTFSHQKHNVDYKIACDECHHVYKDGKNVWKEGDDVGKCSCCHSGAKAPKEPKLSKAEKIKGYHYAAIHARSPRPSVPSAILRPPNNQKRLVSVFSDLTFFVPCPWNERLEGLSDYNRQAF
ncbi:MAG: cytochrome c3 family protein [Deltaproteobacteria bacterium]|nr:cytochrome c3 family protein [Deltaproteobacteria bacterium]